MSVTVFKFSILVCALSLAVAYVAQYGFGLTPCELCMMQRVPYAVVIVLSVFALAVPPCRKWMVYIIIFAFLSGGGIATYHAAVEKHIVIGPTACTSSVSEPGQSVDDLLKKIQEAPNVACDQPQWEFHGITMAELNALWSFMLTGVTLVMKRKENANGNVAG